ncbi:MAG: hypothetical protein COB37_11450 [Kordiimonadales bacterium]|nr:MAG: hypothetical protein COB37_11450 [Kordiimonadales bacterium]
MKKLIIGFTAGVIVAFTVPVVYLFSATDETMRQILFYTFIYTDSDELEDIPGYVGTPDTGSFKFRLQNASFLDEFYVAPTFPTPLTFFRQDPALVLEKSDFETVCITDAWPRAIEFGFKLSTEARQKLLTEIRHKAPQYEQKEGNLYSTIYEHESQHIQQFKLELGAQRIVAFWIEDKNAQIYEDSLETHPEKFDFVISMENTRLEKFARDLNEYVISSPPLPCNSSVDMKTHPNWDKLMAYAFKNEDQPVD